MTFEETITDMSQLADIAYLPYGASINIGDVYYQNVTLSDANGNLKSYYFLVPKLRLGNAYESLLVRSA